MAKPSTVFKFDINMHGIRKHRHGYYFKCIIKKCSRSLNKIKDWNTHHRIIHKTKIKCADCGRHILTPSSHHAHRNSHAPHWHICLICKKISCIFEWT